MTSTIRRVVSLQVTLFKGDGSTSDERESDERGSLFSLLRARRSTERARRVVKNANVADTGRQSQNLPSPDVSSKNEGDESEDVDNVDTIRVIPVLAFDFFSLNTLWQCWRSPTRYSGLILTSPRCVECIEKCLEQKSLSDAGTETEKEIEHIFSSDADLQAAWRLKPVFCVGPSTASKFETFARLRETDSSTSTTSRIIVSPDGNAQSLGATILLENTKSALRLPLLYPCGTLKRDTLGNVLTEARIQFECVTVYKTVQNPDLVKHITAIKVPFELQEHQNDSDKDQNSVYVFYSPSGVNYAIPLLGDLSSNYIVAIGPTTKGALEDISSISPDRLYQCLSPTNEALADVLHEIRTKIQLSW